MFVNHWLTRSARGRKQNPSRISRRRRLTLEALEDRLALATAFALGDSNLLTFDTAAPNQVTSIAISGVATGETLAGIDFRPQNGQLYALGVTTAGAGTLYNVSVRTGLATVIGTAGGVTPTAPMPDPTLAASGFAFDFNPLVDRIRVITSAGQSFAVDPNTGLVVANAPALNGGTPTADGTGYTNNQPNATATTLYTIDSASDTLYLQNAGTSTTTPVAAITLGAAPLDFSRLNGFDIPAGVNATASGAPVTSGSAFAVLTVGGTTGLYNINLVTGQAAFIGNVGNGTTAAQGLAIQNDLGGLPAIGLGGAAASPQLVRFNTANPGTTTTVAITGVNASETLVGIDFRPQSGQLFGLGVNAAGNTATLYRLDPQTGIATAIGTVGQIAYQDGAGNPVDLPDPATAGYGFDFNPTVDRIRVTTSTGLNFRINPNDGAAVDGNLGGGAGSVANTNTDGSINGAGSTGVSGAAYTNSFGQSLTGGVTTQYTLDAASDTLFIQNPPNAGVQTTPLDVTLGGSPLDFSNVNGFDIPANVQVTTSTTQATGSGFAVLDISGVSTIVQIDLATGVATSLGPAPMALSGLTLADAPGAVVPSVTVDGTGKLIIEGSAENDIVTITGIPAGVAGSGIYLVTTQQGSQLPQTRTVTGVIGDICVNLHGGNDQLTMNNAYVNGSIIIEMESGNDTVTLGDLDVVSSSEDLEVTLGTGNDELNGQRIFIGGDQTLVGGDGDDTFTFDGIASPFTLGTSAAGNANWVTGEGDDTVHVVYAFIAGAFAIDLGGGTDSLDIFGSAVSGNVVFLGGAGNDSLTVDTNFFDAALLLDTGADNDMIFLANGLGIDIGTINTGAGDDSVTVRNETQGRTDIDTGSGDDTVDVQSSAVDQFFAVLGDDDDELTLFGNLVQIEADLDGGAGSADRLIDLGNDVRGELRTRDFELFGDS